MLIRALALLLVASCSVDLAQVDQPSYVCNAWTNRCYPPDPWADYSCDTACGDPAYCQDYTADDYRWCMGHPDTFSRSYRYCDPSGNPAWETHCLPGYRP